MSAPVEVTTRYATTVDDLPSAWAFVMDKIERVGPDPRVEISPLWIIGEQDMDRDVDKPPRQFSVVVSGMIHESDDAGDPA